MVKLNRTTRAKPAPAESVDDPTAIPPRYTVQFDPFRKVWGIVDRTDNHVTPIGSRHMAEERAALCSGAWRILEMRRRLLVKLASEMGFEIHGAH